MNRKVILVGALLVVYSQMHAQQQEALIEEVTVASKVSEELYKTGKNVKLLTRKDLEKFKGQPLPEVLQQISGVHIVGNFNNGPEPKSAKIRGGKLANILILIDGIPLKDATGNDYNAMDLRLMALENIESIEMLSGASSVLYGSNATQAVINIKTLNNATKKIEGVVSARAGSYGTYAHNARINGNIKGFTYQITGFNEKSEGMSAATGDNFEKDGFEKQNVGAVLGYRGEQFKAHVQTGWNHHFFNYDYGAYTDGLERGDDEQFYTGAHAEFRYKQGQVILNTRYSTNERLIQGFAGGHYRNEYFYEGQDFFAEFYNQYTINPYLTFTAGVQYESRKMGSKALPWGGTEMEDGLLKDETAVHNADVFAQMNARYKGLHLNAGARMTEHSKAGNHLVYSIHPYYLHETANLYFKAGYSFATALIAPTLYQNFGTLPYTLPNFDLKPETNATHEIELSAGKKDRSIVVNASVFITSEEDAFAYVLNPDYTGSFVNVDENEIKGFEISADYQVLPFLKLGGNFSFVEKENEDTRLRQPKQRVNSYLEILPAENTRITLSHMFTSKRADYYFNEMFERVDVELAPYHLFNLNINQKFWSSFELFANVGNLFNESYTDIAGFNTKKRNYTAGFSYRF